MRRVLRAYVDPRTWGELLYALIGLPLGIAGFVFVVTALSISAGTLITLIGLPLLAFTVVAGRGIGVVYRGLGRTLLGVSVAAPGVQRRRPGLTGFLTERTGWRALAFAFVQLPFACLNFTVAVAFYSYGIGGLTYPLWWRFARAGTDHGVHHHGVQLGPHFSLDTPVRILGVTVLGAALLLASPWVLRGVLAVDRALIRGLLGPTAASQRISSLEKTRALAVDDSAAALRRIERDLHDGAQARLVSLAMSLGLAKEELDSAAGEDPETTLGRVRSLVDAAHREAKGTIIDLRDLARGIHPPALDNGLPDALTTLGARSAVATIVTVDLPVRPTPAVETIVYFCTAELLTNTVKHSGAGHASVDVRTGSGRLFLRVCDDGAGGAETARSGGSGLAGLADRVATVDGTMTIASPDGGPTMVTIEIPL